MIFYGSNGGLSQGVMVAHLLVVFCLLVLTPQSLLASEKFETEPEEHDILDYLRKNSIYNNGDESLDFEYPEVEWLKGDGESDFDEDQVDNLSHKERIIGDGEPGSEAEVLANKKLHAVKKDHLVAKAQSSPLSAESSAQEIKSTYLVSSNVQYILIASVCSAVAMVGIIIAVTCWYKLHQATKQAAMDPDYPTCVSTGNEVKGQSAYPQQGDRKLAQSAQMYHYQHQKQQMIALEKANSEMRHDASDEESENEHEEGDYTVYECPGLAPTGELEVRNPMFQDEAPETMSLKQGEAKTG